MKNFLKICLLFFMIYSVSSCKKENSSTLSNQFLSLHSHVKPDESVLSRIKVHRKGYLVFANRNDLIEYSKLINSPSKDFAIKSLGSKGFQQKVANHPMTSREGDDPYTTVFNQDGLLQVEDILMKISSDEKFFYIVKEQNIDPEVYAELLAEFYDELKMDKINVDRVNTDFDVFSLVDYTPFGINEPEIAVAEKRPCIGSAPREPQCAPFHNAQTDECSETCCPTTNYYFFWILTGTTVSGDCKTTTVSCGGNGGIPTP